MKDRAMTFQVSKGNTLGEYALMLGLLVLVCMAAVNLLGNSIESLFSKSSGTVNSKPVQDWVSLNFGGESNAMNAAYASSKGGRAGGQNPFGPNMGGTGGGVNATSVEGDIGTETVVQALSYLKRLDALIAQETDPGLKLKLTRLASQAYWLAAAEANYEYFSNPEGNHQLRDLAVLVNSKSERSSEYPSDKYPSIPLWAIKNKRNQVDVKANDFLTDPAASEKDKAIVRQIVKEITTLTDHQYKAKIDEALTPGYDKLPFLDVETGNSEAVKETATALLNITDLAREAKVVKTTVEDGQKIDLKAEEQPF
jgi:Flp pilus assembly pilin Flp